MRERFFVVGMLTGGLSALREPASPRCILFYCILFYCSIFNYYLLIILLLLLFFIKHACVSHHTRNARHCDGHELLHRRVPYSTF